MSIQSEAVEIEQIVLDDSLQMRVTSVNSSDYVEVLRESEGDWPFPPLSVVSHEGRLYLCDGWQRLQAAKEVGLSVVPSVVVEGSWLDCVKAAAGANYDHGYRRSAGCVRRACERLSAEWQRAKGVVPSARQLSEIVGCSRYRASQAISQLRESEAGDDSVQTPTLGSDHKVYPQKSSRPKKPKRVSGRAGTGVDTNADISGRAGTLPDIGAGPDPSAVSAVCPWDEPDPQLSESQGQPTTDGFRGLAATPLSGELAEAAKCFARFIRLSQSAGIFYEIQPWVERIYACLGKHR